MTKDSWTNQGTWIRRLVMPAVALGVGLLFWWTGPSPEMQEKQMMARVVQFLTEVEDGSGSGPEFFVKKEASNAYLQLVPPLEMVLLEDQDDQAGKRSSCRVTGAEGRWVELDFSGEPASLTAFRRSEP